jgi:RNA polymerase sigma-B factor
MRSPAASATATASRDPVELLRLARESGSKEAREQLIEQMLPLVRAVARRFAYLGEPVEDLVQVGSIGLLKAIERFDLARGVKLSTYASALISGEIRRHLRDHSQPLRCPRGLNELATRASLATPELTAALGRSPTVAEVAEALDEEEGNVLDALAAREAVTAASLNRPVQDRDGGGTGEELIGLVGGADPNLESRTDWVAVRSALPVLDERELRIVVLRFAGGLTQAQIGEQVGVTQMQVSRLIRRALAKLRARLEDGESIGAPCSLSASSDRHLRLA